MFIFVFKLLHLLILNVRESIFFPHLSMDFVGLFVFLALQPTVVVFSQPGSGF